MNSIEEICSPNSTSQTSLWAPLLKTLRTDGAFTAMGRSGDDLTERFLNALSKIKTFDCDGFIQRIKNNEEVLSALIDLTKVVIELRTLVARIFPSASAWSII